MNDQPDDGAIHVLVAAQQLRRRVPGGIGTYARGLLHGLRVIADHDRSDRNRGQGRLDDEPELSVTVLASEIRGKAAPDATSRDPLAAFGWPLRTVKLPGPLLTRAWDRRLLAAPGGFDVVHSVSTAAPPVRGNGPSGRPTRSTVTVHDMAWRQFPEATTTRGREWHEAALQRASKYADILLVPSHAVATELLATGISSDRVQMFTVGTDHLPAPDGAETATLLHRLGVEGEYLLSVSTLEPRKNLPRLLSAYAAVRRLLPEPWPLVIVGPDGWGEAPQEAPGVILAGSVTDGVLAGLYERARLFAYVPLTEGYGLPPVEAMTFAVPVVASDGVPSVQGQPGEPDAARIVDAMSVESIADGLLEVATNEATRSDLASRGLVVARSRTWGAMAHQHLDIWASMTR